MKSVPESVNRAYGNLPRNWRLERLKFFADVRNSNVDKVVSEDEESVKLCNYVDVYYNDRITCDLPFMKGSATPTEIEKFRLKQGQVIITKDSESWDDIGIPALVIEDMPNVVCGYHLSVIDADRTELYGPFLAWLCRSSPLNDQFKLASNGVTRFGLGQYPMKNAYIALPPIETQKQISQFLDKELGNVDEIIGRMVGAAFNAKSLKEKADSGGKNLIGLLLEYRDSLITAAVTGQIEGLR